MNESTKALPAARKPFVVDDASSANWVVRKIVAARAYATRVKEWSELEQRRAQREEDALMRRFGADLEAWAKVQITQQRDGRQSVSLPAGVIGFRTEPAKLIVQDETVLLTWCRTNLPAAVRTVESIQKTPLSQYLKATGDCPAGTDLAGGGQRFHVTAKNPKNCEGANDGESEEESGE